MKNVFMFTGIPLVRILKQFGKFQVQMRDNEESDIWNNVGESFATKDEAINEAPFLCGF